MYKDIEKIFKVNHDKKLNDLNTIINVIYIILILNIFLASFPLLIALSYLSNYIGFKLSEQVVWGVVIILFLLTILFHSIKERIREQQEKIFVLRWIVREFHSYLEPKLIDEIKFVIDKLGKEDDWMKDIKNGSYETKTKFLLINPKVILNQRKAGYYRDDFLSYKYVSYTDDNQTNKIKLFFKGGVEKIIDEKSLY